MQGTFTLHDSMRRGQSPQMGEGIKAETRHRRPDLAGE